MQSQIINAVKTHIFNIGPVSVFDHSLLVLNIFKKDQLRAVYSVSLKILSFVYLFIFFTVSQPSAFLLYKKELKDKAQTLLGPMSSFLEGHRQPDNSANFHFSYSSNPSCCVVLL